MASTIQVRVDDDLKKNQIIFLKNWVQIQRPQ